jgi:hypothetical protein
VDAGLFHAFHHRWISALCDAFNTGALPGDSFALPEQSTRPPVSNTGCARKADRITVRQGHGDVVAVIEVLSPGYKASQAEFRAFVEKSATFIQRGVHLLLIDLFPPGPHDPQEIHKAIWDEFQEEELELPPGQPLTLAAYDSGPEGAAYVEFVGVGDPLPDMPIFLTPGFYVPAPLEATYQTTWNLFPAPLKRLLEKPPAPPAPQP